MNGHGIGRLLQALFWPAALLTPFSLVAQTPVPDLPTCPDCTIAIQRLVRLGPAGDLPTSPSGAVVDSRGRYWLTFVNELAMVFDRNGRFVMRLKEGGGPGEFRYPWMAIPAADSLIVFDRSGGASIVGPDLEVRRTLQQSRVAGSGVVISWPDSVLLNIGNPVTRNNMSPFHVVSFARAAPEVVRSFGALQAPPDDPRTPANLWRIIAASRTGGLWAAEYQAYALRLWSRGGELQQTLVREPAWFPRGPHRMSFTNPPPPHIQALAEDSDGRLWVFASVAAPTWKEGYPHIDPNAGAVEVGPEAFSNEKLYDTTVEIIDPRTAKVFARATIDGYIFAHLSNDLVAMYDTTEAGEPFVDIIRLVIQQ